MTRGPDAARLLARALAGSARAAGVRIGTGEAGTRPWSSATFEGERITLPIRAEDEHARIWLATLPQAELPMRGWFVAELAVREEMVEALVLRES